MFGIKSWIKLYLFDVSIPTTNVEVKMIEYHNPEGAVGIEVTSYSLSAVIHGTNSIDVGFLANGFPDSENFLHALQEVMQELEPGIEVHSYNKGNASIPANDELLGRITDECQAVIAAYGH